MSGEEKAYYDKLAANTSFVAVRPFENLNMEATSTWKMNARSRKWLGKSKYGKNFFDSVGGLIPAFIGNGVLYEVIYHLPKLLPGISRQSWSPITEKMSVKDVISTANTFYDSCGAVGFDYTGWKILFIMRITWKKENPERRGYEIFVPPDNWKPNHTS
jgi:hypothetical protein